jgi:chorismate--pyruvate lyase
MRSKGSDLSREGIPGIPATHWYRSPATAGLANPVIQGKASYWLTLEGSLTRALQLRCQEDFRVEILQEGWALPQREEALTLGIAHRQLAWIREVCLCGDDQPWVLARTVIPQNTLQGHGRRLQHLGNRPLGAWLFSQPEWARGPFETGLCQRQHPEQPAAARRSRFSNGQRALLVSEYFLPKLLESRG